LHFCRLFFRKRECLVRADGEMSEEEKRAMKIGSTLALTLFGLALSFATARADDAQNQNACMGDAMSVCGQFIPDRERIAHCLMSNRGRVSAPCRVALTHWHG
jgi:hypothetical protein